MEIGTPSAYPQFQRSGGWRDLSDRGLLRISGPDRIAFLHAVLSNDIQSLPPDSGIHSALLTATGKIVSDFFVYRLDDYLLIDVDPSTKADLRQVLEGYIIMEEVAIDEMEAGVVHLALEGASVPRLMDTLVPGGAPEAPATLKGISFGGFPGWVIRRNELTDCGCELIVFGTSETKRQIAEAAEQTGMTEVTEELYEVLRLERGLPRIGIDYSSRNNPVEIQLKTAYSLKKGCYPGQEVVSKATYVGGVARLLVRWRTESGNRLSPGDLLFDGHRNPVGQITSSGLSPRLDQWIGFGLVKRGSAEPGTRLYSGCEPADGKSVEVVG